MPYRYKKFKKKLIINLCFFFQIIAVKTHFIYVICSLCKAIIQVVKICFLLPPLQRFVQLLVR